LGQVVRGGVVGCALWPGELIEELFVEGKECEDLGGMELRGWAPSGSDKFVVHLFTWLMAGF
jgi:hypothetical protein